MQVSGGTEMETLDQVIKGIAAAFAIAAAGCWLYASLIPVPDNLDTIVAELQRISRWNAYAAGSAGLGAVCAVYLFLRP